MQFVANEEQE